VSAVQSPTEQQRSHQQPAFHSSALLLGRRPGQHAHVRVHVVRVARHAARVEGEHGGGARGAHRVVNLALYRLRRPALLHPVLHCTLSHGGWQQLRRRAPAAVPGPGPARAIAEHPARRTQQAARARAWRPAQPRHLRSSWLSSGSHTWRVFRARAPVDRQRTCTDTPPHASAATAGAKNLRRAPQKLSWLSAARRRGAHGLVVGVGDDQQHAGTPAAQNWEQA
jgi:hypothetical protein